VSCHVKRSRSQGILPWQPAVNNKLAPKPTPKPNPNPTLTYLKPNHNLTLY